MFILIQNILKNFYKFIFLFCLGLLNLTNSATAQNFGGAGTKWIYDHSGGFYYGITKVQFEKDTVLNNRNVQKYSKKGYWTELLTGDSTDLTLQPIFLHSHDGIVEYSEKGNFFDILYNFNAEIGETWTIYDRKPFSNDSIIITVIDTFRSQIDNISLFTQVYEEETKNGIFIDTIYEQIGSKWSYILPFDAFYVAIDEGEGGILRCFFNYELEDIQLQDGWYFGSYIFSSYVFECDGLTAYTELKNTYLPSVSPNPFNSNIFINQLNIKNQLLEIYNNMGQLVYKTDINNQNSSINTQSLIAGVYFIFINKQFVTKVIKQ